MKTFISADTHFGHHALFSKYKVRPTDFEDRIVKHWKRVISNDDLVIHLGDFCIGNRKVYDSFIHNLPGRKILVLGNHDKEKINWYMNTGFDFCCSRFDWHMFGLRIRFSHIPELGPGFDLNIHGHLHGGRHRNIQTDKRHYLVALEETAYQPILLKTVVATWEKNRKSL